MAMLARWFGALMGAMSIGACDWIAQGELRPGESTGDDVRRLMGKPGMVWEEPDGSQVLEFARGPEGHQTFMVEIGPDGRFRGMKNVLTSEFLARVRPGVTRDEARRILGQPTEVTRFPLKPDQEVWTWRYQAEGRDPELFHARIGPDGVVLATESAPDPHDPRRGP